MPPSERAALAATAKRTLGLHSTAPDAHVPHFYMVELSRHLALCKNEDNFRVTLQPNIGFGTVECLKEGCNKIMVLGRRTGRRVNDGGKADGFGTLSTFREHLADHKAMSRPTRVKSERDGLPNEEVKRLVKSERPPSVPPLPTSSQLATTSNVLSVTPKVKVEPPRPPLPRKRLSDVAFEAENQVIGLPSPVHKPVKKIKTEVVQKGPLASVTNNAVAPKSAPLDEDMFESFGLSQDPWQKLNDIRIALAGQQSLLARLSTKPTKSFVDMREVLALETEIQRLKVLEQDCQAEVSVLPSSSSSNLFIKSEPTDRPFPVFSTSTNTVVERKPIMQPFPTNMDIDKKPFHLPSAAPAAAPAQAAERSSLGSPNPFHIAPKSLEKPIASSSTAAPDPIARPNAIASASKKVQPLLPDPPRYSPELPDDYSSDEGDSYEYNLPDTSEFMKRIGIQAPAAINDDPAMGITMDATATYSTARKPRRRSAPFLSYTYCKLTYGFPLSLEKFLIQAGNAEAFDGEASVEKALKRLGLQNINSLIPGMEVSLMVHQAIGVAWMVDKESSDWKAGCLADEMGLGKTVQMIATMLMNRPTDPACKTTLIVAPLALLDQWKAELEEKTNCGLKCHIYHGNSKVTSKKKLLSYDVVLATFGTVSREWPDFENEMKKKKKARKRGDDFIVSDSDEEEMKDFTYRSKKRKEKAGLLFQVEFYRAVLDEGQNIRNRRTRISRAVTDIQATYRWCLTGTPIINTLMDAYGYIRFLKIRPWYDWDKFNSHIGIYEKKRPDLAVSRLHAVMNAFMLRRKKDTMMNGKILVPLPKKEVKLVKLEFSDEERAIYKMVEARNQATFNRYLRAGTVLKNYSQVLVLLLRLRQICSHPSLIAEDGVAFINPDEVGEFKLEFATELSRARRLVSEEFVNKMKEKFKKQALDRLKAEQESTNATIEDEDCPICFDAMSDAVITPCGHIFCKECVNNYINTRPAAEAGTENGVPECPCCREPIDQKLLFARSAFEPTDKELNPQAGGDSDVEMEDDEDDYVPTYKGKGKGKATARPRRATRRRVSNESDDGGEDVNMSDSEREQDDDEDMSDFIVESDEDEEEKDARRALKKRLGKRRAIIILDSDDEPDTPEEKQVLFGVRKKENLSPEAIQLMPKFLPSSKMKYMMVQLEKLVKSKPDEKTLIVSQWTSCLSLVSDYLTENGIPHVKYQGDMSRTKRDQAVRVFMAKEKARVMLMSLKCGGVGLNLTRANNVISLDLGWSQAVESQAFDRVHRLGQRRDVLVQRVVIADTVEDRILQMQERKQTLADGTLGEGSAKKMGKLSVKELANLFGLDARGRLL